MRPRGSSKAAVTFAAALIHPLPPIGLAAANRAASLEAVERFVPSLAAGAILTVVFFKCITDQMWMMPGLWAVCFSLGLFASRTLLPHGITIVAGYYLIAGCLDLVLTSDHPHQFSPWAMSLTFGVGQLLCAAVLYWNLERKHV